MILAKRISVEMAKKMDIPRDRFPGPVRVDKTIHCNIAQEILRFIV